MVVNNGTEKFIEKRGQFYSSAKVHLRHLHFDTSNEASTLDPKNVDRLIQVFKLEGDLRLELEHRVPALIELNTLSTSCRQSHVNRDQLYLPDPPKLEFPEGFSLLCLNGKHRIEATRKTLLPVDRWWTVDLYSDGGFTDHS